MTDPSPYHARLPYGERLSAEPVLDDPFFPLEGDIRVRPLADPVLPEPPRMGEPGGKPCGLCADPDEHVIWRDERWIVQAGLRPTGLPMVALLSPVAHVTLHTMPAELAADLGTMIQRVALAIGRIDGVGRVHFSRFGDGSEHFHMWFRARPLGMMQLRGPMLAVWDDLLPQTPEEELSANMRTVATALAERGGRATG
jgi:diadenosine tetraphosphate (Ap4A) HIT family hydrolase